jgi:hypothetical protein
MIVDPDFPNHWKTRMLVDLLDGDEAAPVYLIRLWAHCQNRRTSTFENLPQAALKALCRFPGHSNKFESSLVASGFVRREGGTLIVCGWDEYNASLIANWSNGGKGGRPKKVKTETADTPSKTHGLSTGNPSKTHGEPIREDKIGLDKNREIPPTPKGGVEELAEALWNECPKLGRERSSMAQLVTSLRKVPATAASKREILMGALNAWKLSESWLKDGGQFVPAIHRWVKDGKWKSIPEPWTPKGKFAGTQEDIDLPL